MSHLFTILRAAHCRSTHHYFALDALNQVSTEPGKLLAKVLLKYHDDYLVGAKAPDTSFRDFQNHVLHVGDNYWGGAVDACEDWLEESLDLLNRGKWKRAAFALGVLSHYFTDPLMPLHTAQSERESVVHRPMEWSICKSYDTIYEASKLRPDTRFELPESNSWLTDAVTNGATIAHGHYYRLLEIYDLEKGCKHPPSGLNEESRERLSQLFSMAIQGWARVLDKIAAETSADIPELSLGLANVLAAIDFPFAWVVRKIASATERSAVKRLYREWETTGKLDRSLPAESRVVRSEKARAKSDQTDSPRIAAGTRPTRVARTDTGEEQPSTHKPRTSERVPTPNLTGHSDLVDAPSIGPKTAKRFIKIGIRTVEQFLQADPNAMEKDLATSWITEGRLRDWQDQARLVCEVPALCGYKAQLLVEVGVRTATALAAGNSVDLGIQIEEVALTSAGRSILRSGKTPDAAEVQRWVESASSDVRRAA
ncbi:MAG: DUF4332 domain-containing protein [Pirellulaceae bacterium]